MNSRQTDNRRMQRVALGALVGFFVGACHSSVPAAHPAAQRSPSPAAEQRKQPPIEAVPRSVSATSDKSRYGRSGSHKVDAEVRRIIKEQLDVDEKDIRLQATFIQDLGADSLGLVELVLAFEEAFGIDIPDQDAERIRTVGDAISYIETRTAAASSHAPQAPHYGSQ